MRKYLLFALMLSGLMTSAQTSITNGDCKAQFKYRVNDMLMSPIASTAINFDDRSEGNVTLWWWDFGDGTTSTEQNPFHVFNHPIGGPTVKMSPYRTVSLTVLTADSCKSFYSEMINIVDGTTYVDDPNTPPVIDSTVCYTAFGWNVNYDIKTFAPAVTLDFYSKADPEPVKWSWDFGDGTFSEEQDPTHGFNYPIVQDSILGDPNPFRTICLTVTTVSGCVTSSCQTIDIYKISNPPVDPPVYPPLACSARYKYYQTEMDSVAGKVSFQFNNYSEGDSLSYLWYFDNGITSTEKEPVITFDIKQLPLKASLTTNGKNGCSDTFWDGVYLDDPTIYPPDSAQCSTAFGYTVNYTVKTFAPALVLDFYAKASPDAIKWSWDFGDGTTSDEQNPMHIFNLPLYTDNNVIDQNPFRNVCLTVTTANGCVASYCESIDIFMKSTPPDEPVAQCQALFKYYRPTDVISIPEVVPFHLVDVSGGNVVSRLWQFEDGTTSFEAEPMVNFDFMKPMQKVCLTIYTADSCSSTYCDVIYVNENWKDTTYIVQPEWTYSMRVTGSFPIQMSSCAGTAHAQVYLKDSLVTVDNYVWSTGVEGPDVKGLCPTQTYSVKAITPDGSYVSSTFTFNSDGTVTEIPTYWYLTGGRDDQQIKYNLENKDFSVEWHLCDGTVVYSDSIPLNSINCGAKEANMVLKDASGNVVYTENISLKTLATQVKPDPQVSASVKLYPNPVKDVLNIKYSGKLLNEMQIEICDIAGRNISSQKVYDVESGQNISLNVNSLRNGIYLCKMISGKQVIGLEKFVK